MSETLRCDVVIVGSGAGASAVGGELAAAGAKVIVLEAGPQWFDVAGTHIRDVHSSEADLSKVGDMIYGELLTFPSGETKGPSETGNWKVAHGVGGMFALWMGNCPFPDAGELPRWMATEDWQPYFERARALMHIDPNGGGSGPRFERMVELTRTAVGPLPAGRSVCPMPLAARRIDGKLKVVASDDLFFRDRPMPDNLTILADRVVHRIDAKGRRAVAARAHSRHDHADAIEVLADNVVIAGGTVGSAQLIASSALDAGDALGRYIFEHPCIGSRIVLKPGIRAGIPDNEPVYSIWVPYSHGHEWQNQVCRFTLASDRGGLPADIREVDTADIFTFVAQDVRPENRLIFDETGRDPFGLPKVSARYSYSAEDRRRIGRAMAEHFLIASEIGDIEFGWNPSLYAVGGSTHFMGSCRMGATDDGTSVVDVDGRLWRYENVFVAGNAVLGTSNAGNPTFTAVAQALRTSDKILGRR